MQPTHQYLLLLKLQSHVARVSMAKAARDMVIAVGVVVVKTA
jgi:hypothetical protein